MYKTISICIIILCISTVVSFSYGQLSTPHSVRGEVTYPGGGSPPSVTFSAYITDRPGEVLSENSNNCGYYINGIGIYYVQCSEFSSGWNLGLVLHIDMFDGYGGHASDEITLTGNPVDTLDLTILDSTLPVNLFSFEAKAGDQQVTLEWITACEVDNLGFHIERANNINGPYTRLTHQLIEGAGNTSTQHTYEYLDHDVTNGIRYWYRLSDFDVYGESTILGVVSGIPTRISASEEFSLYQNYPNPFNPKTSISYQIPENNHVILDVYNMKGRFVRNLVNTFQDFGFHSVVWDGTDHKGKTVSSGTYLYMLRTNENVKIMKSIFIN